MSENISLTINCDDDNDNDNDKYNVSSSSSSSSSGSDLFLELLEYSDDNQCNAAYAQVLNYDLNYTTKQLSQICDYYGIKTTSKRVSKKSEILNLLVTFETTQNNYDLVSRRKQLWYYIGELKNDKYMKKFVIW
jgi:hypothetical protein